MKKTGIILLMLLAFAQTKAQEFFIDSMDMSSFKGFCTNEMGDMLGIPYFSTNKDNKQNFVIKRVNAMNLIIDGEQRLEIPETYKYINGSMSGGSYLMLFYDTKASETVMMLVSNNNVEVKKTIKAGANEVMALTSPMPDNYTVITSGKRGAYTITLYNRSLEKVMENTFSPPAGKTRNIVSVKTTMEGIKIVYRDTDKDNKFAFHTQNIRPDSLIETFNIKATYKNINTYPTFSFNKDGITCTGGIYYQNGLNNNQKPDGVYISTLTPDGKPEMTAEVPYSQVIEDLKERIGDALSAKNTGIIFTGGIMAHESQSLFMIGEMFTRNDNTSGGSVVKQQDLIILRFNMEGKYLGAEHIKVAPKEATVSGDLSKLSNMDLAAWLRNSGFGTFKYFMNAPMVPAMVYLKIDGKEPSQLCFQQGGSLKKQGSPHCFDVAPDPISNIKFTYKYNASALPNYPLSALDIIPNEHVIESASAYKLEDTRLRFIKVLAPPMDAFMDEELMQAFMPQHEEPEPPHEDNPEDEKAPEEGEQE
ncbi:MAG: hypothetical protein H6551_11865 [Chitinophagales bacterium]|nr:hypothetical protein [Chitinophagaceae bacterium]MCB9065825.1 hypothetical protein [Chitinophagales bacterium]